MEDEKLKEVTTPWWKPPTSTAKDPHVITVELTKETLVKDKPWYRIDFAHIPDDELLVVRHNDFSLHLAYKRVEYVYEDGSKVKGDKRVTHYKEIGTFSPHDGTIKKDD